MEWGGYGTTAGKFRYPRDLAVDKENKVYVADGLNYRIQKFSSDGTYELSWGSKGSDYGQFSDHFGISVDSDNNVYVADVGNNRIQKFTSNGEWIGNIGDINQGTGEGEFYYPMGIEVYLERPLPYPTEVINTPSTEVITPTPTLTYTIIPIETVTNTPADIMGEEDPSETKITPTFTPVDILTKTGTPIITPTQVYDKCKLYYSIEYSKKKYHFGKLKIYKMILRKFWKNIWNEKISIYECEEGGYIYEFEKKNLKILVYDPEGCYLDEIEELIAMKNKFRKGNFYCWFEKKCIKKYHGLYDRSGKCNKCDDLFEIDMEKNILIAAGIDNTISKEVNIVIVESLNETNTYNYPNPFKDRTTIRFSLNKPKDVKIVISDVAGKIIWQKNIMIYETRTGINYQEWTGVNDIGLNVANGTYLLKIITDEKTVTKKLVKVK